MSSSEPISAFLWGPCNRPGCLMADVDRVSSGNTMSDRRVLGTGFCCFFCPVPGKLQQYRFRQTPSRCQYVSQDLGKPRHGPAMPVPAVRDSQTLR